MSGWGHWGEPRELGENFTGRRMLLNKQPMADRALRIVATYVSIYRGNRDGNDCSATQLPVYYNDESQPVLRTEAIL